MNNTWSVFIGPYLVATVVPSISGSRSRCTPSRLTDPPRTSLTAILSISSRKTMPLVSAFSTATRLTSSWSMRFSASSSTSRSHASGTFSLRRLSGLLPMALPNMSDRSIIPTPPGMPGISIGELGASRTSISTSVSFIELSTIRWRNASRVASLALSPTSAVSSRSIAALLAASRTASRRRSFSRRIASSTRSRAIWSTSRPT